MGGVGRGELNSEEELRALLFLRLLPGVGDRTVVRLLQAQGSARRVLERSPPRLGGARSGAGAVAMREDPALKSQVDRVLARSRELDIRIVPYGAQGYPPALLGLVDPPPVLFMRGDLGLLDGRCVAVVGSRKASPVGRRAAERLARELSGLGVTVVSGLAFGIDAAAHRGALAGPGRTIAVLGSGPDRSHPAANRDLFQRILTEGLLVSEFPPGEPARPFHFPRRNRILAGLTRAVVVVEAARRSGAIITVDHALDLGLEIFAVPGSVESPQSAGTNALIRDGAHLLTQGEELLEILGWPPVPGDRPGGGRDAAPGAAQTSRSADEGRVMAAVIGVPRALDELVLHLALPPETILSVLTRLELSGTVVRGAEGWSRPG